MLKEGTVVQLFLNNRLAGSATVGRHDAGWTFGDFVPSEAFGDFAPLFGRWSLLMHADSENEPLSRAAADELRETEAAIDQVKAFLRVPHTGQEIPLGQVNIDGPMIEWKEA